MGDDTFLIPHIKVMLTRLIFNNMGFTVNTNIPSPGLNMLSITTPVDIIEIIELDDAYHIVFEQMPYDEFEYKKYCYETIQYKKDIKQ